MYFFKTPDKLTYKVQTKSFGTTLKLNSATDILKLKLRLRLNQMCTERESNPFSTVINP